MFRYIFNLSNNYWFMHGSSIVNMAYVPGLWKLSERDPIHKDSALFTVVLRLFGVLFSNNNMIRDILHSLCTVMYLTYCVISCTWFTL